jgi:hypothetical protein
MPARRSSRDLGRTGFSMVALGNKRLDGGRLRLPALTEAMADRLLRWRHLDKRAADEESAPRSRASATVMVIVSAEGRRVLIASDRLIN